MKHLRMIVISLGIGLILAAALFAFNWFSAEVNQTTTPPEDNTPERLIHRLAVAYDERDWDVYNTVYTARVQRFLQVTCGSYQACFSEHRDTVQSPIDYEITNQREDGDELIIDVRYTHPAGEWCQTYTVVDTEFGWRVDFSTEPADC
jgi:hypothetical protein